MGAPPDEVADRIGRALGGKVSGLRRLPGGASRQTSVLDLHLVDGTTRSLVLQQDRATIPGRGDRSRLEAELLAAARANGVPVPGVVAAGPADGLPPGWLLVERVTGEPIPRKILRDPEWAQARSRLAAQCGGALAGIHAIPPSTIEDLPRQDPLRDPGAVLDDLGVARPALELGVRWLDANRPAAQPTTTVHGDFRLGNLMVGRHGLVAVLDWELAHAGEAAEDIGWLCAPAWRFGEPGRVGGFGELETLLDAYAAAGGDRPDEARVHWWEIYATVKWAVICTLQASAHLSGRTRSLELAAIGRRVCECEWDLFSLLGVEADGDQPAAPASPPPGPLGAVDPFGRPTLDELADALAEHLARSGGAEADPGARFDARIAARVAATVSRQLRLGPAVTAAHARRLERLGVENDAALVAAIRRGDFDADLSEVGAQLAASTRDQLLVANPSHLGGPHPRPSAPG